MECIGVEIHGTDLTAGVHPEKIWKLCRRTEAYLFRSHALHQHGGDETVHSLAAAILDLSMLPSGARRGLGSKSIQERLAARLGARDTLGCGLLEVADGFEGLLDAEPSPIALRERCAPGTVGVR